MISTRFLAVPVIVAVLLGGCAALGQTEQIQAPTSDELSAVFGNSLADYNVAESPKELAEASEFVVKGIIVGIQEGRELRTAAGGDATRSVVIVVDPDHVAKGTMPKSSDGHVYIELLSVGQEPAVYEEVLPPGTSIVAFLQEAWGGEPGEVDEVRLDDPTAGRPAGQVLYMLVSPQGFAVQYPQSKEIVWPLGGDVQVGSIEETLPSGSIVGYP